MAGGRRERTGRVRGVAGAMRRAARAPVALLALGAMALAAPATASAVSDCPNAAAPRTLVAGQGVLESVIVDPRGRLFYTDGTRKALMRLDRPGAQPAVVADGIDSPGGLALEPDGDLVVGYGNGFLPGAVGNVTGLAGLLRVDPDTGERQTLATGLSMANGVVRAADGTIYASQDVGLSIDRVAPDGTVQRNWARVLSSNGLALSRDGRTLYAAQTFVPAAIAAIDVADPARVSTYVRPGLTDIAAGLDGMTIDGRGRLFVAANGGGQVWRVDTDRSICALARGLLLPSAVALGTGGDFPATSAYAVTFSGSVIELPRAR